MTTSKNIKALSSKIFELGFTANNIHSNIKTKNFTKEEKSLYNENVEDIKLSLRRLEIKRSEELRIEAEKEVAKSFNLSWKNYNVLTVKAYHILQRFNTRYSMGDYKRLRISDFDNRVLQMNDSVDYYAKSSKFRGSEKYGIVSISLTMKQLKKIENIGGIYTVVGKRVDSTVTKIHKAQWLQETGYKQHYKVELVDGYICHGFHGNSVEVCEKWYKEECERKLRERTEQQLKQVLTEQNLKKFVGLQHSHKVGNCDTGTKAFANRHNLDVNLGYRVDYLLSLEPNNLYVQRFLTRQF